MNKIEKAVWIIRDHGVTSFVNFVIGHFIFERSKIKKLKHKVNQESDLSNKFKDIYQNNLWGSKASRSGPGSESSMTENLRRDLPLIIEKYHISSIVDIPCGDFLWMQEIVNNLKIRYLGIDIVEPLVELLKSNHEGPDTQFLTGDMRTISLPCVDLVVSRDILFHLSYSDTALYLENLLKSNSKYFLTTSYHPTFKFKNKDIVSGDFRLINLFSEPYNFPSSFLEEILEPSQNFNPPRSTYFWKLEDLILPIQEFISKYKKVYPI